MSLGFFESKYGEAFRELGIPLTPGDGVPEYEIGIQEQVFEFQIPKSLRVFYSVAGNHELVKSMDDLYPIGELYLWEDYLVFMRVQEDSISWGIRVESINDLDPVVHAGLDAKFLEPYSEEKRCSDFLMLMICTKAISGGFEHSIDGHIKLSVAMDIKNNWKSIGGGFYSSSGKLVYFSEEKMGDDESILVTLAGRTEKDFMDIMWTLSPRTFSIT